MLFKMKKLLLFALAMLGCMATPQARPVDEETAKEIGLKFVCANFGETRQVNDLQLVYTGNSDRGEVCFYAFNAGMEGFVIVSADDRFRPIVGYSDEGPFETENMSPELQFYLEKIIEARTSRNAVFFDDTAEEWQSVAESGKLLSRNGGRGVDFICTTKWNQDSPYNLYAPEASSGPGGRCYAGCVATAMSQVMKQWDSPIQGKGSHSYYCPGYGRLEANFGETTYNWSKMPDRLGGATQEEVEAVALLMYHCAIAVDMGFSPSGSGANSWDVPRAIRQYFYYSNHSELLTRDMYSLTEWQDMLKESFDIGWPVYYSGFSSSAGHAFVCDGYDDNDLFHFNWGWGGSSDGWFVIDEIDYASWAQAVFNYVPTEVYEYMPLEPDNLEVISLGDNDFSATLSWNNPTQDIHFNPIEGNINQMVVTRNGQVVFTADDVAPGAAMSFTDHYMPTTVDYAVYAIVNNAKGIPAKGTNVTLGPSCLWTFEMTSSEEDGWYGAFISLRNSVGAEIAQIVPNGNTASQRVVMPVGHVELFWHKPTQAIEHLSFNLKDADGQIVTSFDGSSADLPSGLFFVANNTCGNGRNHDAPKNLVAVRTGNDIVLTWEAPEGSVNHYAIYRDNLLYALSETVDFTDSGAANAFHSYYITTLNDAGESDPSNVCNMQDMATCEAPSNLRYEIANNKAKLSWDAPEADNLTGYFVYRRAKGEEFKRVKSLVNTTYSDNINNQENNVYEYAVAAYYSADDCTSAFANAQDQPELNYVGVNKTAIPQNLTYSISGYDVTLNWEAPLLAETFNVYRDGEKIAEGLTDTTFTDEGLNDIRIYYYTITGQNAIMESSPSNEAIVNMDTDIPENTDSQITIYPNPSTGLVFVEGSDLTQISVFNLMGQEVRRIHAQGPATRIDLSDMPDGVYIIKAFSESGTSMVKIMKIN